MNRRKLLQRGFAGLALPTLGRALEQPAKSGTQPNKAGESHTGMRAYVGDLAYSGSTAPALVVEPGLPWRLVCWAEAQYVPYWDIDGVWVTTEWFETLGTKSPYDYEPISDKELRYTHVELAEIGPARAVVHWRYSLCDTRPEPRVFHDNTTAEEFHTVYPDGITVRKLVGYPGNGNPVEGAPKMWEVGEMLLILPQGSRLEDDLDPSGMTISNIAGDAYRHRFLKTIADSNVFSLPADQLIRSLCTVYPASRTWSEYIYVGSLKNRPSPFMVVANNQEFFPHLHCLTCGGDHPESLLWMQPFLWKHYPQFHGEYHIGVEATEADLQTRSVSTSYVTVEPWMHPSFRRNDPNFPFDPKWNPPRGTTWLMLQGVNPGDENYPRRLAAAWLHPGGVKATAGRYLGYVPAERAYRFAAADYRIDFELTPAAGYTQINPVVVVEDWHHGNPQVALDGQHPKAEDVAVSWTGGRLIVWFRRELTATARFTIEGWPGLSWMP
jgi:hypothetical protein